MKSEQDRIMTKSQKIIELEIFKKFAEKAKFDLIDCKNCDPPEPDIFCIILDKKKYFELTDASDEFIQKSSHDQNSQQTGWFNPFPEKYRKKFDKKYRLQSLDCDLLIYFSIAPTLELGEHFNFQLEDNENWIKQNIGTSPFQRVWIYDVHNNQTLSRIEKSQQFD